MSDYTFWTLVAVLSVTFCIVHILDVFLRRLRASRAIREGIKTHPRRCFLCVYYAVSREQGLVPAGESTPPHHCLDWKCGPENEGS